MIVKNRKRNTRIWRESYRSCYEWKLWGIHRIRFSTYARFYPRMMIKDTIKHLRDHNIRIMQIQDVNKKNVVLYFYSFFLFGLCILKNLSDYTVKNDFHSYIQIDFSKYNETKTEYQNKQINKNTLLLYIEKSTWL